MPRPILATTWQQSRDTEVARLARVIREYAGALRDKLLAIVRAKSQSEVRLRIARIGEEAEFQFATQFESALRRLLEWSMTISARKLIGRAQVAEATFSVAQLMRGLTPAARQRKLRDILFAPPSREVIKRILYSTTAPDAIPWSDRIKTVQHNQLRALARDITTTMARGGDIEEVTQQIEHYVENIHWMARRIARTEGVRVAEAGVRETVNRAGDLIYGVQWYSALTRWTREDHAARHGTIYVRQADGSFVAEQGPFAGEVLPTIPLGPNCLCWTAPILTPAL